MLDYNALKTIPITAISGDSSTAYVDNFLVEEPIHENS